MGCIITHFIRASHSWQLFDERARQLIHRRSVKLQPAPSASVPHSLHSFFDRTIRTTVEGSIHFYSMANNATTTAMTRRGQGSNRAFKAVEDMCLPTHDNLKGFIIFVVTPFTLCHMYDSFSLESRSSLSHGCCVFWKKQRPMSGNAIIKWAKLVQLSW